MERYNYYFYLFTKVIEHEDIGKVCYKWLEKWWIWIIMSQAVHNVLQCIYLWEKVYVYYNWPSDSLEKNNIKQY